MRRMIFSAALLCALGAATSCSSSSGGNETDNTNPGTNPTPGTNDIDFYLTKGDRSTLLEKQTTVLDLNTTGTVYTNVIDVSEGTTFQTMDGFGYTLTGGSVQVINSLNATRKQELLQDVFSATGIGVSYLRVSIGASDLNSTAFTYDDMPTGQTDVNLTNFSLSNDNAVIAMLKEILAINPNIKIIATPWSAPAWMKDNGSFIGGNLKPEYQQAYANYFVKYLQAMRAEGINIEAITPQNEPLNPNNNPSMYMAATQQRDFIKNNLGPALQTAGFTTKIIVYDHNPNDTTYPLTIYNDAAANAFVDGSAWHLYEGEISGLSTVHNLHPNKNIYFTEQYTAAAGDFGGDLKWHLKNVLIGATRNWSKNVLEWNLANDSGFGPYTQGGCTTCKGAITITSSDSYQKNVAYYIIAHASKFVQAGSVRISSNITGNLNNVAFKTPQGKYVLIVENDGITSATFTIRHNGQWVAATLPAGGVGTYVW
ncbi:MAG: glycoside hydrolase family 30 protein [Bacteroidia bacterium]